MKNLHNSFAEKAEKVRHLLEDKHKTRNTATSMRTVVLFFTSQLGYMLLNASRTAENNFDAKKYS